MIMFTPTTTPKNATRQIRTVRPVRGLAFIDRAPRRSARDEVVVTGRALAGRDVAGPEHDRGRLVELGVRAGGDEHARLEGLVGSDREMRRAYRHGLAADD